MLTPAPFFVVVLGSVDDGSTVCDTILPMRLVCKLALYTDEKAFGEGPFELLSGVERDGSLRRAAAEMGMSYTKAWRLVRTLEQRLGFTLLERHVGGTAGGGSGLTADARELLRRFAALELDATQTLDDLYRRHFGDFRPSGLLDPEGRDDTV